MSFIQYEDKRLTAATKGLVTAANAIIEQYQAQGYSLTLRQLYYQFVARDLLPNTMASYKTLGGAISAGRRAGLVDWDAITDRTRNLVALPHWRNPAHIIADDAKAFHVDLWEGQETRVEVWVEKDALSGVVERACRPLDVAYFACRGYTSDSEMWAAGQRLLDHLEKCERVLVLHFGDHDPSGIDMTRDVRDRLDLFTEGAVGQGRVKVRRLALNLNQVQQYRPPPNPAKIQDTRFAAYAERFGTSSWELDALEPGVIVDLIRAEIAPVLDVDTFAARTRELELGRKTLQKVSAHWPRVELLMAKLR